MVKFMYLRHIYRLVGQLVICDIVITIFFLNIISLLFFTISDFCK